MVFLMDRLQPRDRQQVLVRKLEFGDIALEVLGMAKLLVPGWAMAVVIVYALVGTEHFA